MKILLALVLCSLQIVHVRNDSLSKTRLCLGYMARTYLNEQGKEWAMGVR
jgi:hypothetical protein